MTTETLPKSDPSPSGADLGADSGAGTQPEPDTRTRETRNAALARVLKPKSIAIVGLSDNSPMKDFIMPTFASGAELFMVNPRYETVLGRPTFASITDVGQPLDVVMCFMSAERTAGLVEEAAGLDVGGLVLVAGGFAETSTDGDQLQRRMRSTAIRSGMEIVGPNGLGYINVPHGISLTIASRHKRRPGGISVISQSGAMLSGVAMAAWEYRGTGLNVLVSAGNEAVTDLAAYVDYLVDDPETTGIGLIIEKVRRPAEFFAAVARATEAGKPVVALKLARSARTRQMAASHTGSLTGDAWVYDVALRQAGVALAYDPEELVDRLAFFEQIPQQRWSGIRNLGVVTMTGGFASLSADLAAAEDVNIPALDSFAPWIQENLPGVIVPNPLDTTGLGGQLWPEIVHRYASSDELDAIMVIHPVADEDTNAEGLIATLVGEAAQISKPVVLANCSGVPGEWSDALRGNAVAAGRGLRPTLRGLATLGRFVEHRKAAAERGAPGAVAELARPTTPPIAVAEGAMLPFAATMDLLHNLGFPTAPYALIAADADPSSAAVEFAGPWVVKLADVAHRTELGAVKLSVVAETLPAAVAELREIASAHRVPALVAVQPMVRIEGEAFVGIQGASELGPLTVFGLGGILVEALGRVGGRMAPFDAVQARELIDEFADLKLLHGFRGKPAWDLAGLADLLVKAGNLAAAASSWLDTLDVNPLVWTGSEFIAVDALAILRP